MGKLYWKPGNMLYPLPVVMVSVRDKDIDNIITVAWAGTINSDPAMLSISVRKERFSYDMLKNSGEFVVNLVTKDLAYACDYCGVASGRDVDKFKECKLTKEEAVHVNVPMIKESPVNIECKVERIEELGSHHMFIAKVLAVHADEKYMDETGRFDMEKCKLISYSHGQYYKLGERIGKFGYSVQKKK
jgi:flavin reductase (DIM6/NTAB) family NADH-FMN oxidoreductase RutF